jgi:hypothetical protein
VLPIGGIMAKSLKDERPARARYWSEGHLKKNKVRNLVKHCGMDPVEAEIFWTSKRKRRIKV